MAMCSINIPEMTALVAGLVSAQESLPGILAGLTSTMEYVDLDAGELARARPVTHWVSEVLVPTRRRLAIAQAIEAATPNASTFVQFDEAVLSTKTPAQAAADAKQAAKYLRAGDTPALLELLSAEAYDPYFAKAFAQQASCRDLENYVARFGLGQLNDGVDPKQYETVLTALGQTLGLASRGQGDLDLGPRWRAEFLQAMTAPKPPADYATSGGREQYQHERALRSALMLIFARGQWSTGFLQHAVIQIQACDQGGRGPWAPANGYGHAVTPAGTEFSDPVVALMAALAHNPAAARWAFTQGGTTPMRVSGHDVPVNAFLHYALIDHHYLDDSGPSAAVLALRAAAGGDKHSPVALDARTVSTSLAQQQARWAALPWYEKWGHSILDFIGMIPLIGDVANVPNAAWYSLQGDWVDAGITEAGMLPLVGDAALGGRLLNAASDTAKALRMVDLTGKDIEDGLESAQLLSKSTQIEPAVFKFDNLRDFRLAQKTPHPDVVYEYRGLRYTTDSAGEFVNVEGRGIIGRIITFNWADDTGAIRFGRGGTEEPAAAETAGLADSAAVGDTTLGTGAEGVRRDLTPLIRDPQKFDPGSLRGVPSDEVRASIPKDWEVSASKRGAGIKYSDPAHRGRTIRLMPGYAKGARPDDINAGPYAVVAQNGKKYKVPLAGNPVLK